ncbi:hypothetical protein ABIB57_002976 [Devosia sp. UYZn731]|uniref:hypothetical protein n=1 Tax=Devosia sp. UYZn731 TaxID=3156345 RepID=UPI003392A21E
MVECDLVMKGGVTSGVVYPNAIVEVARKYRLSNIGGTSAGATAAVIAAAAEYRRQSSTAGSDFAGFDATAKIAEELGTNMLNLFQPSPDLTKLFSIAMSAMGAGKKGRVWKVLSAVPGAYPWHVVLALAIGLVLVLVGVASESGACRSRCSPNNRAYRGHSGLRHGNFCSASGSRFRNLLWPRSAPSLEEEARAAAGPY